MQKNNDAGKNTFYRMDFDIHATATSDCPIEYARARDSGHAADRLATWS